MRLNDIGRHASGVDQGVMDARRRRHVLAQIVDADVHQFDRVERAAAKVRCRGGMSRPAEELKVDLVAGQRHRLVDAGERGRVP